ncbi:Ig-like domain-containing protein [Verminephrobacter eiseniae]
MIDKPIVKAGETAWFTFCFTNNEGMYLGNGRIRFLTVTGGTMNDGSLIMRATSPIPNTRAFQAEFRPTADFQSSDCKIRYDSPNNEADAELTFAVDTLRPTVASASVAKSDLRLGEKTTITITFSELVTRSSFTLADLQVDAGKGTLSNLRVAPADATATDTAATTWLVDLEAPATRPATGLHGNQIRINLDGITDVPGNAGAGRGVSVPARYNIDDGVPPTVTIALADTSLLAGETMTVTFTFSENVTSFGLDDLLYDTSKGTLSALTQSSTDSRVWSASYTPRSDTESANNTIRVNLGSVRDAQDNAGSGTPSSGNFSIDTLRPTVARASIAKSDLRLGEKTTITITFSELVTRSSFTLEDLQVDAGKGTLSNLRVAPSDTTATTTAATTWLVDLEAPATRPATGLDGNQIRINLDGITDVPGNAGASRGVNVPTRYNIDDGAPPTVAIALSDTSLLVGETMTVTFTFSERITGFGAEDILYDTSKGTLSALTQSSTDSKVWTASYTPRPDTESASNTIRVNLSGVRDALDNAGSGTGTSGNFSIDTRLPTVNVTISDNRLTAGETATLTITFSERVTGFTKEAIDLSQANGKLGDLVPVGTDGKVWTATFTPTASLARTTNNRLSLNLANVRDAAGNAFANNTYSFNQYTVDTMVFVLSNATVDRDQLVLSYGDETALDGNADRAPTNESFTVLVDGTRIDVSRVTVDAAARTVTLTLARAVTTGQTVTVAYQDTDTSDGKALQEAGTGANGGDAAASFAARAVTNLTQPPVAPATPDGSDGPDALDSDRDGLSNNQEDLAIGLLRPDGSAGMEGDGNGDGIKDSQQAAVASNRDLTLVAGSQDGKLRPDSNAHITELVRSDAPANLPKGMEMPIGLTSFKAGLSEGRSTESFSLYVDPALGVNGYWLKNSAGTWVNLASEPYGGKAASEGGRMRLDFLIQDGGQYDADGQVNGSISAPGAVAKMPLSIVGQMPDSHSFGFWY